jgi:hypothetical protein
MKDVIGCSLRDRLKSIPWQQSYRRTIEFSLSFMAKKKKWYAVRAGYKIGVFETWDECKLQVDGFKGAAFKAFDSHEDALLFLNCSQATAAVPQANHCSFSTAAGVASGPANVIWHVLTGPISVGKRPRESDDLQLLQHSKSSLNSSATSPSDHTTSPRSPRCRPPAPRSNLSDDQFRFCELAESGCNVFLTGLGGTGKSHVLKLVVKNLRLKHGLGDRKLGRAAVMLASSTGVSAVSIGGVTLHSLAGCGVPRYAVHFERMWSRKKMWKAMRVRHNHYQLLPPTLWPFRFTHNLFPFPFQVLVLDEISMIQVRLLR